MNELVIIDIDNTLIKGQSQEILLRYLYSKKLVGLFYFVRIYFWFVLYKMGLARNPRYILEYAVRFLKNKKTDEVENLVKRFVIDKLQPFFFKGMLEIIQTHKSAGRKIILVSNAIDVLVKAITRFVSADDFIASKLEIKDNVYTGKVEGQLIYAYYKCSAVKKYLHNHPSFNRTWAYTDHRSDIPLLSMVDYPYAVNPDRQLRKVAAAQDWFVVLFT